MLYSTVLFDFDGTLFDTSDGITGCVQYALEKFGIASDKQNLQSFIGPPLAESFRRYYGFSEEQAVQAVRYFRERYPAVCIRGSTPYGGITELLQKLQKAGVRLGIATGKPQVFAEKILQANGLSDYFAVVVGSDPSGTRQDKAEIVQTALDRLQVSDYGSVALVGDTLYDVLGATQCGIDCIGVEYGFGLPGAFRDARYTVPTVSALEALLLQ